MMSSMDDTDMENGFAAEAVQEQAPPPPAVDMYRLDEEQAEKERRRKRKIGAIALMVFVVVGVALGVGLALGLDNGDGGGEPAETKDLEPDVADVADAVTTEDRTYVNGVCSADNLRTADGFNLCQETCSGVGCCQDFSYAGTCLDDDLEYCVSHSRCHVVEDVGGFDPAPVDLEEICSVDSIASDRTRCERACRPVDCCFQSADLDSCQGTNLLACLDYSFCQNLDTYSSALPVAPTDLDQICSEESIATEAGAQECSTICREASCCTAEADSGSSCLRSDFISCMTYAPCGRLSVYGTDYVVPPAPRDIDDICSKDEVLSSQAALEKCLDACRPASCCAASDSTNCFLSDPVGCLEYASCGVLFSPPEGGELSPAPFSIDADCSPDNIGEDDGSGGRNDCETLCEESSCCFDLSSSENCLGDGNLFTCLEYTGCLNLQQSTAAAPAPAPTPPAPTPSTAVTGTTLEEPDGGISDACNLLTVLDRSTADECRRICASAKCCQSEEDSCYDENEQLCDLYYGPCASLVVLGGR